MSGSHPPFLRRTAALASTAFVLAGCSVLGGDPVPTNVVILIGDGMGYNQVDLTSLYERGRGHWQVAVDPAPLSVRPVAGPPVQAYEDFPVALPVATYSVDGSYDPTRAWSDFDYRTHDPTDSAAAATAMSTGVKTYDSGVGVDPAGAELEQLPDRAAARGRGTGVVTSVPISHATPAAFAAHEADRDSFSAITDDYLASDLDVVMGAGHPGYTDDHTPAKPNYKYMSTQAWDALVSGATPFAFIEDTADFEALANSSDPPDRVFGVAQVATTLQQGRSGDPLSAPGVVPRNDVPGLATMTRAALNVLDDDPDGLFLMVEGGAIDWAGHDNQAGRMIEETQEFNAAVQAVIDWVEASSSWEETLVVVTADHETGYLTGPGSDPGWTPIAGQAGEVPEVQWNSEKHTNTLVPLFARGAGASELLAMTEGDDPVRGPYLDNTDLPKLILGELWE